MKNKVTMIISSCDKFSDIWKAQTDLLNRNWPNREFKTLLVTDKETNEKFENIDIFPAGENLDFSERLKLSLEKVSTEYVFITLDDYFITKKIKANNIKRLIQVMDNENIDYIRVYSKPKTILKKLYKYKNLFIIDTNKNYSVNLYPGLWRVSFLKKTFTQPLSAWEYEVKLSDIAQKNGAKCLVSSGNEYPILNGIIKGKFFIKANKYLKKHNLYFGNRAVLSISETIKYKIKLNFSLICPDKLKRKIKNVLREYGYEFYSD